jgi:hypothetical protein
MLAVAEEKAARLNLDADWVLADTAHLPESLHHRFDLVYTGRGALNWMMDIDVWARNVCACVRPGGHYSSSKDIHSTGFGMNAPRHSQFTRTMVATLIKISHPKLSGRHRISMQMLSRMLAGLQNMSVSGHSGMS